jgi:hypothetical protein
MNDQQKLVAGFLDKLMSDAQHVDDVDAANPIKDPAQEIGKAVTFTVGFLSNQLPNKPVNKLMRLVWDLIGSRTTPIMLGMEVESPTVAIVGSPQGDRMAIMMPLDWIEKAGADVPLAMSAIIYCGSYGVDFYNDKIRGEQAPAEMATRAGAYESEFLHTWLRLQPGWLPNAYHHKVMQTFPQGISTPGVAAIMYESRKTPTPGPAGRTSE